MANRSSSLYTPYTPTPRGGQSRNLLYSPLGFGPRSVSPIDTRQQSRAPIQSLAYTALPQSKIDINTGTPISTSRPRPVIGGGARPTAPATPPPTTRPTTPSYTAFDTAKSLISRGVTPDAGIMNQLSPIEKAEVQKLQGNIGGAAPTGGTTATNLGAASGTKSPQNEVLAWYDLSTPERVALQGVGYKAGDAFSRAEVDAALKGEKIRTGTGISFLADSTGQGTVLGTPGAPESPAFISDLPASEREIYDRQLQERFLALEQESSREIERIQREGAQTSGSASSFLAKIGALGRSITGAPAESRLGVLGNIQNQIDRALQEERNNLQLKKLQAQGVVDVNIQKRVDALNELKQQNFENAYKIWDAELKERQFNLNYLQTQEKNDDERAQFEKTFGFNVDKFDWEKLKFADEMDLEYSKVDLMEKEFVEKQRSNFESEDLARDSFYENIRQFNQNYNKGEYELQEVEGGFAVFDKKTGNLFKPSQTRADRHNNPLAMMYDDRWASLLASQGINITAGDPFDKTSPYKTARFDSVEDGIKGAKIIWQDMESRFGTVGNVLDHWSGRTAAQRAKIDMNKKWSELSEDEKDNLLMAQMQIEGFNQGNAVEIKPKSKVGTVNSGQIEKINDLDDAILGMSVLESEVENFSKQLGPMDIRSQGIFGFGADTIAQYLGGGPSGQSSFETFSAFKSEVDKVFQKYRKVTTGAAASDKEIERLIPNLPKTTDKANVFVDKAKATLRGYKLARDMYLSNMQRLGYDVSNFDFKYMTQESFKQELDSTLKPPKKIKVKEKSSGREGMINESDFDPNLFTKIP